MATPNLSTATRDLVNRSIQYEVFRRMAFLDELDKRSRIVTSGGKTISKLVDYAEMDNLAQAYSMNETMTTGENTSLALASFNWKYVQLPIKYGGDVEVQNVNAGKEEQLVNLAEYLSKKAMRGIRIKLEKMIANAGSTTTTDYNDTGKNFNSMVHALKHVTTAEAYGNLSRGMTAGTRNWWQGQDSTTIVQSVAEGTTVSSVQGTAMALTLAQWRACVINTQHSIERKADLMTVVCPTLFNQLKAELTASMMYQGAKDTAEVGFQKMYIDGHQIADWDYLETSSTMKAWMFLLNLETWELHFNKARNFRMLPFKYAGELPDGQDFYLSRILLAGNLCCFQPDANMLKTNMS